MSLQLRVVAIALGIIGLFQDDAGAAIVTFTDRTAFDAAAGITTLEDFNSFVTEETFHTVPLDVGDFTISMTGAPITSADRNKIDIPPHEFAVLDVDGTPVMNVLIFSPETLVLTFDNPITAFGADFSAFNNQILRTVIDVNSSTLSPPVHGGDVVSFFGFVSDTPFTSLSFREVDLSAFNGDGFGIDNIAYSSAVPEPTSLAALFTGLVLAVGGRLRQRRRTA